jgi:hypothetical protein
MPVLWHLPQNGLRRDRSASLGTLSAKWAALCYNVRRIADRDDGATSDTHVLQGLRDNAEFFRPTEALDRVIVWFGRNSRWPGETLMSRIHVPSDRSCR